MTDDWQNLVTTTNIGHMHSTGLTDIVDVMYSVCKDLV